MLTEKEQTTLQTFREQLASVRREIAREETNLKNLLDERSKAKDIFNKEIIEYTNKISDLKKLELETNLSIQSEKEKLDEAKDQLVTEYFSYEDKITKLINNADINSANISDIITSLEFKTNKMIDETRDLNTIIKDKRTIISTLEETKERLQREIHLLKINNSMESDDLSESIELSKAELKDLKNKQEIEKKTLESIQEEVSKQEYIFKERMNAIDQAQKKLDADIYKARLLIARANRLWSKINPNKEIE